MESGQCSAKRTARVPRRGLDPHALERAVALDLAIGHTVKRNSAGQTEVAQTSFLGDSAGQPQHDFLSDRLNGRRQVHVALSEFVFRLARQASEERIEA